MLRIIRNVRVIINRIKNDQVISDRVRCNLVKNGRVASDSVRCDGVR